MARINNALKFTLIHMNILYFIFGSFLLSIALYLLIGNFGSIDRNFSLACAAILILISFSFMSTFYIGLKSIQNQQNKFGKYYQFYL